MKLFQDITDMTKEHRIINARLIALTILFKMGNWREFDDELGQLLSEIAHHYDLEVIDFIKMRDLELAFRRNTLRTN